MKKNLLFLLLAFPVLMSQAQPVLLPNGDFETWTSTTYNSPDMPWFNSNDETISYYGKESVKKITGFSGSYAIRLETVEDGFDTSGAYITNSLSDIENGEGGVPFTFQATNLNGTYRYNLVTGDTAFIILIFKKNASIISYNIFKIHGSQSAATPFTYSINAMGQSPDSMIIAVASGNVLSGQPKYGSWIELDDLTFDDGVVSMSVPGGDFENWTAKSLDEPGDWILGGGNVSRTNDKYSGSYAAQLTSKDDGSGWVDPGSLTLGSMGPQMGMPYTKMVDTLIGYYKYNTPGSDVGFLVAYMTDANGNIIGQPTTMQLNPAANYTYFELPLASSVAPARLAVSITSSDYSGNPVDGSTLYLDDLKLKNTPLAIGDINRQANNFAVYPNPASNILFVKAPAAVTNDIQINIIDVTGKTVYNRTVNHATFGTFSVPVDTYTPGIYHYTITSGDVKTQGKFIKE